MSKPDGRDTLPCMPPGAPDWAQTLYDMMLHMHQTQVSKERTQDARLLRLEAEVFGPDTPSFCEEDTDPGPRN